MFFLQNFKEYNKKNNVHLINYVRFIFLFTKDESLLIDNILYGKKYVKKFVTAWIHIVVVKVLEYF